MITTNTYLPPIINGKTLVALSQPGSGDRLEERLLSGKDGVVLKLILKDAGLDPQECSYSLWDHIPWKEYSPTRIIAIGNEALRGLTKKSGIKKYRGQVLTVHESIGSAALVYPTYSIKDLRNVPTYLRTMIADIRNARERDTEDTVAFEYWTA